MHVTIPLKKIGPESENTYVMGNEGRTMATHNTVLALIEQVNDIRMVTVRNREHRRDLDLVRTELANRLVRMAATPPSSRP